VRNVFLIGFMGAGKTSVGRLLAGRLNSRFVDLDAEIESAAGKSISEIFDQHGETEFRKLETTRLTQISREVGIVVATGGGVAIAAENRQLMRMSGLVVNLTASRETILQRLSGDRTRPLLQGDNPAERVAALLTERQQFYAEADLSISTDGKKIEEIVAEILARLSEEQ
jgi:shikimate kinase